MKSSILQLLIMFLDGRNLNDQKENIFLQKFLPQELLYHYIEAVSKGETALQNELFAKGFRFRFSNENTRGDKDILLKYLTLNANKVQESDTSIDILEQSDKICLAKVRFNFSTFVREDYITLQYSKESWKIHKLIITTM